MNASLVWSNLTAYSLQVAVLVAIAAVVPAIVQLRMPGARLLYWHLLLAACLALPLVRPWRQVVVAEDITMTSVVTNTAPAPAVPHGPTAIEIGLTILAAGVIARLVWLGVGFWRLGRYRREATVLQRESSVPLLISEEISGPVTFGFRHPVILLPARFPSMPNAMQEAILCHEMLHVQRRDWLFTVFEEFVRALFWFHPAIWWLLGQIQLTREQAVDQRVIEMTQARDPYVDALLAMAGARPQLDLAPAPLFLRKRHLKQRVAGIFKDVRMSRRRLAAALVASVGMMLVSCWFVAGTFPLAAAPQAGVDGAGVAVDLNGAQLLHRSPVAYPPEAQSKGVSGTVVAQVKIDRNGEVSDASIVSGPEELRRAVLESVLGWHFMKSEAGTMRTVSVTFAGLPLAPPASVAVTHPVQPVVAGEAPKTGRAPFAGRTIKAITMAGASDEVMGEVIARLPIRVGDVSAPDTMVKLVTAVKEYDPHLTVRVETDESGGLLFRIAPIDRPTPGERMIIRVGSIVQSANLVSRVRPIYPPEAKQARVQGTVQLNATIGPDGKIEDLKVVSGDPLLVRATLDAVKQWVYRPTLLNGNPVTVKTTIDVNFTLAQ